MRVLTAFLLCSTILPAQVDVPKPLRSKNGKTLVGDRDTPIAQIHRSRSVVDEIKAKRLGVIERAEKRDRNVLHFTYPSKAEKGQQTKAVAVFGRNITYRDPETNTWKPVAPVLSTTDNGWIWTGTPTQVVLSHTDDKTTRVLQHLQDPETGNRYWLASLFPRLTHTEENQFTFQYNGHPWTLWLRIDGFSYKSAPFARRCGTITFSVPFESSHEMDVAADGSLMSISSPLTIARAVMVGADAKLYPCGAWTISNETISFSCDDSRLPADAFPYIIDPTLAIQPAAATDEVNINDPLTTPSGTPVIMYGDCSNCNSYGSVGIFSMGNWMFRYNREMFFRFDTSSIPDNATIVGASIKLVLAQFIYPYYPRRVVHPFHIYWYPASLWPLTNAAEHWGDDARSVYAGYYGLDCTGGADSCPSYVYYEMPLTQNLTQVNKTGYTGIRFKKQDVSSGTYTDWATSFYTSGDSRYFGPVLTVDYTVNSAPSAVSGSAFTGDMHWGQWITATARVSDPDGYSDIEYWHLLINNGVAGGNACYVMFHQSTNSMYLRDDANTAWSTAVIFGSSTTIANSQCEIDAANSSLTVVNANTVQANIRLRFLGGAMLQNPQRTYIYASDWAGENSGWAGPYTTGSVRPHPRLIVTHSR